MSQKTRRIASLLCALMMMFSTCVSAFAMDGGQAGDGELTVRYEDYFEELGAKPGMDGEQQDPDEQHTDPDPDNDDDRDDDSDADVDNDDDTDTGKDGGENTDAEEAGEDEEDEEKKAADEVATGSLAAVLLRTLINATQDTPDNGFARTDDIINEGWTFTHGEDSAQDGEVNLPHTWNVVDTDLGYGLYGGTYFRGEGTYEKTLDVSGYQQGKVFLKFEAVNKLADVYIDGEHVGRHIGGYTAFTFDITEHVQNKDSIEIKVVANNSINYVLEDGTNLNTYAPASTTTSAPDYNIYGGIYRDVHVINTSQTHFALESEHVHSSNGIYLDQSVSNIRNGLVTGKVGDATLDVTANVVFEAPSDMILSAKVYDKDGEQVASASQVVSGEAGLNEYTIEGIEINSAHLWNGRVNGQSRAYLYRVVVNISDTTGNVVDQVVDRVGFRTFEFRSVGEAIEAQESGEIGASFLLNGEEYPLYGAAMHADFKDVGNALAKEHWNISFALMNEVGLNTIRAAHYPYPQYFYSQADERGYVVWAENASTNSMSDFEVFVDQDNWVHSEGQLNTLEQLRELVCQNYNHPSIYTWCLTNEVSSNGDTTGGFFGGWGSADRDNVTKQMVFMRQMDDLVREIDSRSGRLISLTANFSFAGLDDKLFYNADGSDSGIVDLIGAHYYFGTYTAGVDGMGSDMFSAFGGPQVPTGLRAIERLYPDSMISIREYGVGGDPHVYMKDATGEELNEDKMATTYAQLSSFGSKLLYNPDGTPYLNANGTQVSATNHPIEYTNRWHEMTYDLLEDFPWVMGTYIWNMFDFGINHRTEGGTTEMAGRNDKGLVSFDREIKKDTFFYYKAQWNKVEDFVHINTGERWVNLDTREGVWNTDNRSDRYWDLSGPYVEQTYDIRVYSTIDYQEIGDQRPLQLGAIQLYVNGTQVNITPERVQKGVYVFQNVPITSRVVNGAIDNEIRVEVYDYTPITNTVGSLMMSTTAGKEDYSLATTMSKYADSGYHETPLPSTAVPGDNTLLTTLIEEADKLSKDDYTAESWTEFEYALGIAKQVAADSDAVQEVINAVLTYLQNAILGLIKLEAGDAPWVSVDLVRVGKDEAAYFAVHLGRDEQAADSASLTVAHGDVAAVSPATVDDSGQTITITGIAKGHTTVTVTWIGGPHDGDSVIIPVYVTDESQKVTYPVIFVSDGNIYAIVFAEEYQSAAPWPADPVKAGYRFDGWFDDDGKDYTEGSVITGTTTITAKWTSIGGGTGQPSDSGGSRSRSSNGGSSGGGSAVPTSWVTSSIAAAVSDITQAAAVTAVTNALAGGGASATVRFQNPGRITLDTLKAMAAQAGDVSLTIHADSMVGGAVGVRLYLNPALASTDLNLAATVSGARAAAVKDIFGKWFSNKLMAVSLEQEGAFGQAAEIAVKLSAELAASKELVIYSYNSATNSYSRLADQTHRVDGNGYLRFRVTAGGSYVISDGVLAK